MRLLTTRHQHGFGACAQKSPTQADVPRLPLVRPSPPRLSEHLREIQQIEDAGIFSNYGPVNTRLEEEFISSMFQTGACVTVCNATIGLMMAIREVIGENRPPERRYALMPSFTFAATAHAALWCGLTPLLCDIDPDTWLPCPGSEEALLAKYAGQIAVVVPYATFGNNLDLIRYRELSQRHGVPVVVDAAASLGSLDEEGNAFGSGFPWPVVFSMHATKAFSVGEGGIIYCADASRIARLRCMGSFGFGSPRSATALGINSKLSEVGALSALLQVRAFPKATRDRENTARLYRKELGAGFRTQHRRGQRQVPSFESVLLPHHLTLDRAQIVQRLSSMGVGSATYFSPHLAEQPYFRTHTVAGPLPVTNDIASRILSLPLLPGMSPSEVRYVATSLRQATALPLRTRKRMLTLDVDPGAQLRTTLHPALADVRTPARRQAGA